MRARAEYSILLLVLQALCLVNFEVSAGEKAWRLKPPEGGTVAAKGLTATKSAFADSPLPSAATLPVKAGGVPEEGLGGGTPIGAVSPKGGTVTACML